MKPTRIKKVILISLLLGSATLASSAFFLAKPPVIAPSVPATPPPTGREIDYPKEGVMLGTGWSSLDGIKTPGQCIEFVEQKIPAQETDLRFEKVVDKDQLNRELKVSMQAQARGILGMGGSAKADFSKSLEIKDENLNLLMQANVNQGPRFVAPRPDRGTLRLTSEDEQLAARDPSAFRAKCGDSFVATIYEGAELNALLSFNTSSREERERLEGSLKISGAAMSLSGSTTQTLRTYQENQRLSIALHIAGGNGTPLPVNEDELEARVKVLPNDASTAPQPFKLNLLCYDTLPNWPKNLVQISETYANLEAYTTQYQRLNSVYESQAEVIQHPEAYAFSSAGLTLEAVKAEQDQLRTQLLPALRTTLENCLKGGDCPTFTQDATVDYQYRRKLPVRRDSFEGDSVLFDNLTRRDQLNAQIPNMPEFFTFLSGGGGGWMGSLMGGSMSESRIPNPERQQALNELAAIEQRIPELRVQYLERQREAVFQRM